VKQNGAPDPVGKAMAATEPSSPPETFVIRAAMERGRMATITLPQDITDEEFLQLVGILTGPGRVELAGARATAASKILVPTRAVLRPV
jgi:hypothetical protein